MGNIKSKKVKISQSETQNGEDNKNERINALKSDISDANIPKNVKEDDPGDPESKDKDHDNASSASTVEALDDK